MLLDVSFSELFSEQRCLLSLTAGSAMKYVILNGLYIALMLITVVFPHLITTSCLSIVSRTIYIYTSMIVSYSLQVLQNIILYHFSRQFSNEHQ